MYRLSICVMLLLVYLCHYYAVYQECHYGQLATSMKTELLNRAIQQGLLVAMLVVVIWFNSLTAMWSAITCRFVWSTLVVVIKLGGVYLDGSALLGRQNGSSLLSCCDLGLEWTFGIAFDVLQRWTKRPVWRVVGWTILYLVISQIRQEMIVMHRISETVPYEDAKILREKIGYTKDIRVLNGCYEESAEFIRSTSSMAAILDEGLLSRPNEQVEAVIAHELGHWYYNHNYLQIGIDSIFKLLAMRIAQVILEYPEIFVAMDLTEEPSCVAYTMGMFLTSLLGALVEPLRLYMQRQFEFAADHYAMKHGYGVALAEFLSQNDLASKGTWLYNILHRTHPFPAERITALGVRLKP